MSLRLSYATVRETPRQAIYVVRVQNALLDLLAIEDVAERMRNRLEAKGEISADVVVTQGDTKETFRLYGNSFSVSRVRAAMFHAAISWIPIEL